MTLEEKAEEWVKDNCCDLCVCQDECEIGCIHCGVKDGYLAGAKEGLKMKVNTTTVSDAPLMEREQLELAKMIIKNLKDCLSMYSGNYQKEIAEAEQFLKE